MVKKWPFQRERKLLGIIQRSASVIAPGASRSSHLVKITQDALPAELSAHAKSGGRPGVERRSIRTLHAFSSLSPRIACPGMFTIPTTRASFSCLASTAHDVTTVSSTSSDGETQPKSRPSSPIALFVRSN